MSGANYEVLGPDGVKEEFKTLLEKQAEEREKQREAILQPGHLLIEFPDQNFLDTSSMRFDPMNISLVEERLLCHRSILTLGKEDRFSFKLNWQPILTEIAPGNLFMISKIYFSIPEDAQMTIDGESISELTENPNVSKFILDSKSIHMEIHNAEARKENSHTVIKLR